MANKARIMDRSNLKIRDLKARQPAQTKLMNVKIPGNILQAIEKMANTLDATKTAVVVALLQAGIEQMGKMKRK